MSRREENSVVIAPAESQPIEQEREAESRIARLRAELDAIRCSRQALHEEICNLAAAREDRPAVTRRSSLGAAVAVAAACGFAVGLFFFAQADMAPPTPDAPVSWKPASPLPTVEVSHPDTPATADEASPFPNAPVVPPEKQKPGPVPEGKKTKPPKKIGKKPPEKKRDGLDFLDKCGDDPMCGFDKR